MSLGLYTTQNTDWLGRSKIELSILDDTVPFSVAQKEIGSIEIEELHQTMLRVTLRFNDSYQVLEFETK